MIQKGGDCVARGFVCNIGRGNMTQNCCDGREEADGPNCHFKDGIDYEQMRLDHAAYHALEAMRDQQGQLRIVNNLGRYRRRATLSPENQALLDEAVQRRIDWMNTYLRPECINCDGFCTNHQGRIRAGQIQGARAYGTKKIKRRGTRTRGRTRRRGRGRTRRRGRGHGKKRRNHSKKR
jgi:hypothetical protein